MFLIVRIRMCIRILHRVMDFNNMISYILLTFCCKMLRRYITYSFNVSKLVNKIYVSSEGALGSKSDSDK